MSDYISREEAFNAVLKLVPKVDDDGYCWVIRGDAATAIDSIPASDVRPVVTCGECEFWDRERISCEGLARCNTGESGIRYRNQNDFCSRGKKREES